MFPRRRISTNWPVEELWGYSKLLTSDRGKNGLDNVQRGFFGSVLTTTIRWSIIVNNCCNTASFVNALNDWSRAFQLSWLSGQRGGWKKNSRDSTPRGRCDARSGKRSRVERKASWKINSRKPVFWYFWVYLLTPLRLCKTNQIRFWFVCWFWNTRWEKIPWKWPIFELYERSELINIFQFNCS